MYLAITTTHRKGSSHPLPSMYNQPPSFDYVVWEVQVVMLIILFTFALVHSGLASLRGVGEKLIGERAFRVLFAASSLPLAVSAVVSILFTCPSLRLNPLIKEYHTKI